MNEEFKQEDVQLIEEAQEQEKPKPKAFMEQMRQEVQKGIFVLNLRKPLRSGKKELKTLSFDLSTISAADMIECERQWEYQFGRTTAIPAHSSAYLLIVAAKSLEITVDDLINGLSMKEATAVCNCVAGFLMS